MWSYHAEIAKEYHSWSRLGKEKVGNGGLRLGIREQGMGNNERGMGNGYRKRMAQHCYTPIIAGKWWKLSEFCASCWISGGCRPGRWRGRAVFLVVRFLVASFLVVRFLVASFLVVFFLVVFRESGTRKSGEQGRGNREEGTGKREGENDRNAN